MDPETETYLPAPLDKSKVRVGDTVTVTIAARNGTPEFQITGPVYGDGDMDVAVGDYMLMHDRVTLLAHTPAPKPTYPPETVATATVRGFEGVTVIRTYGTGGDALWVSPGLIEGTRSHGEGEVTNVHPLVVVDPETVDVEELQYAAEKAQGRNPDALAGAKAFLAKLGIEAS